SQALRGEGVETGREPPDRDTAQVKAQSRPQTLRRLERRRKPKWYGIRRVLVRAQEGQLEARCDATSHRASRPYGTRTVISGTTPTGRVGRCGRRARCPAFSLAQ